MNPVSIARRSSPPRTSTVLVCPPTRARARRARPRGRIERMGGTQAGDARADYRDAHAGTYGVIAPVNEGSFARRRTPDRYSGRHARVGIEHRGREHRPGRDRAGADVVAEPDHHVRGRRRPAARPAARNGPAVGRRRRPRRPGAVLLDVRDLRPRHLARVPPLLHAPLVPGAAVAQGHAGDPRLDDAAGPRHAVGDRSPQAPRAVRPARRPALAAHARRRHLDLERLRHVARPRRLAVPHEGHGARRALRPRPARGSHDPPDRPPLLRLGRASRSPSRS